MGRHDVAAVTNEVNEATVREQLEERCGREDVGRRLLRDEEGRLAHAHQVAKEAPVEVAKMPIELVGAQESPETLSVRLGTTSQDPRHVLVKIGDPPAEHEFRAAGDSGVGAEQPLQQRGARALAATDENEAGIFGTTHRERRGSLCK